MRLSLKNLAMLLPPIRRLVQNRDALAEACRHKDEYIASLEEACQSKQRITAPLEREIDAGADEISDLSKLPGIFLNTMPKSASVYIFSWIAQCLNLKHITVSLSLFPDDLVIREKLDVLVKENVITQEHIPATDINLRFIAARMKKLVVHVRDPRQATLSWVHHLDRFHRQMDVHPGNWSAIEAVTPALPEDYFQRTFEEKIDWQIDNHLPLLVGWTEKWLDVQKEGLYGLDILITQFESFVTDPEETIRSILRHYGISEDRFDWSLSPEKTAEVHFRKGRIDEWLSVFTTEQRERAGKQIPEHLRARFNWHPV